MRGDRRAGRRAGEGLGAVVVAMVSGIVRLTASGNDALARTAVSSFIDPVLPVEGVLSALDVLDLDGAPDADAVRAPCERGAKDAEAWEADEESDESLLERISRRIGGARGQDERGGGARRAQAEAGQVTADGPAQERRGEGEGMPRQ